MLKIFLVLSAVCLALTAQAANEEPLVEDSLVSRKTSISETMLRSLEPTYLKNVTLSSGWKDNWFVGISGGASAFAGTPLGCEDLFGRIKPTLHLQVGKWFTPAIGTRVSFRGFELKNSELQNNRYKLMHADLLVNVASYFNKARDEPRWDVVPYAGLGLIHNEDNGNCPFAFSYGVMGRYRLSHRLHLTMEVNGTTTFKDFDGRGASREFGDNLVSLTAGLSVTLGKSGWKKVVDAKPYIQQNDWLLGYSLSMANKNRLLDARHKSDSRALAEMRKILEIEGLLKKYGDKLESHSSDEGTSQTVSLYPKNDYSGLNSLMERLRKGKWNMNTGKDGFPSDSLSESTRQSMMAMMLAGDSAHTSPSDEQAWNAYLLDMSNNRSCIGAPVYFFFKIDTHQLSDHRQLINLDEIARVAKKYDLRIRVTGAADSATGSKERNSELSRNRARYICEQLVARGLNEKYIAKVSMGGVSELSPNDGNRFTRIELFFEPK